jgi:hypothetical protein
MIAIERSARACVLATAGERFSVQSMKMAFKSLRSGLCLVQQLFVDGMKAVLRVRACHGRSLIDELARSRVGCNPSATAE